MTTCDRCKYEIIDRESSGDSDDKTFAYGIVRFPFGRENTLCKVCAYPEVAKLVAYGDWPDPRVRKPPPIWPKCVTCSRSIFLIRPGRDECAACRPVVIH